MSGIVLWDFDGTVSMVGDNPEADVEGARAAGLSAILVRRNGTGLLEAAREILAA